MSAVTITDVTDMFRDMWPQPGERLKQWVVDQRREAEWERATCPRVTVDEHDDNTGLGCRNVGQTQWSYLDHDACYCCNSLQDETRNKPEVMAWLVEKSNRPPIEADRTKYSDEVQADWGAHPSLAMFGKPTLAPKGDGADK